MTSSRLAKTSKKLIVLSVLLINSCFGNLAWAACYDPDGDWNINSNITITEDYDCTSITVENGYTLTVDSYNKSGGAGTITLTANTVTVKTTAKINASGKGYPGGQTAGAAGSGTGGGLYAANRSGGGGHGGQGATVGSGSSVAGIQYGSIIQPTSLGSGGAACATVSGPGGNGGGAIRLNVNGTLALRGALLANGNDGSVNECPNTSGGGSGGSVYVTAGTLTGAGRIRSNGGSGNYSEYSNVGGAGSGGRIAVYYSSSTFTGTYIATGSSYVHPAGSGTIFIKNNSTGKSKLIINNSSTSIWSSGNGPITKADFSSNGLALEQIEYLQITNGSIFTLDLNGALQLTNGFVLKSSNTFNQNSSVIGNQMTALSIAGGYWYQNEDLVLNNLSTLTLAGTLQLSNGYTINNGAAFTISSGGNLTHKANTTSDLGYKIDLRAATFTVNSGGKISANGLGYLGASSAYGTGSGPGAGSGLSNNGGGGGGHGGYGGNVARAGAPYGSVINPNHLGSGGGGNEYSGGFGGTGGGLIKLVVNGNFANSGAITANGSAGGGDAYQNYGPGGGSGGSIYIESQVLSGAGSIKADGGSGGYGESNYGYGGSGGRIAVYYTSSTFTGRYNAKGGAYAGYNVGAAGTVYLKNKTSSKSKLLVDNSTTGAWSSGNGPITTASFSSNGLALEQVEYLQITNGSIFTLDLNGALQLTNGVLLKSSNTFNQNSSVIGNQMTTLSIAGYWYQNEDLVLNNLSTLTLSGTMQLSNGYSINNGAAFTISSGGNLTHKANTTSDLGYKIDLTTASFTISSGGKIDVSGKGYLGGQTSGAAGSGPGAGSAGGGGGYGGAGGNGGGGSGGGSTYGSSTVPVHLGSGGAYTSSVAGGSGGGSIRIVSSGALSISGKIVSNGNTAIYGSGAGSGGSIFLSSATFSGAGTVRANGGISYDGGGGGGGGRIAMCYGSSTFSGSSSVTGGTGAYSGSSGTITYPTDCTSPYISSFSPADEATGVNVDSNLIITFSENIDIQTGNILIKLSSDNSTVQTITATGGALTGNGTTQITINPSSSLSPSTSYYINIDSSIFDDTSGNSYEGISSPSIWNFTTGAGSSPDTNDIYWDFF